MEQQPIETQPSRPGIEGEAADVIATSWRGRRAFVPGMGWGTWRDGLWRFGEAEAITARNEVDGRCFQMADAFKSQGNEEMARAWRSLRTASRVRGVLELLSGKLLLEPGAFDQNDHYLGSPTGVIDLMSGFPIPHDASIRLTQSISVEYDPFAPLDQDAVDTWNGALSALPDDAVDWFQAQVGMAFTGRKPEFITVNLGDGRNGKSTLMDAIMSVAGEYGVELSDNALMTSRTQGASPEIMALRGKRLAVMEETPEEGYLNVARLKKLADTDRLTARYLYQKSEVTFRVTHSIFLNTNYLPRINETDSGTWRRLRVIPFMKTFVEPWSPAVLQERGLTEQPLAPGEVLGDPNIKAKCKAPAVQQVILRWVIEGAKRALSNNMPPEPQSIRDASSAWREDMDSLRDFVAECLVPQDNHVITATEMTSRVGDFLKANGKSRISAQSLAQKLPGALERAGLPRVENKVVRLGEGITVTGKKAATVKGWRGLAFSADIALSGYIHADNAVVDLGGNVQLEVPYDAT